MKETRLIGAIWFDDLNVILLYSCQSLNQEIIHVIAMNSCSYSDG